MDVEPDAEALGRALVARRAELEISRPDLARSANLSYPYVYEIERGRKYPSANALESLAAVLELTPTALIERSKALIPEPPAAIAGELGEATASESDRVDELTDRVLAAIRPSINAAIAEALGWPR